MIEIKSRYARELLQWIIVNCAVFPLSIHCTVLAKRLGWKTYGPKVPGGTISCPAVGEAIRALVRYGYITFTQPKRGWYVISITQTLQTIVDAAKSAEKTAELLQKPVTIKIESEETVQKEKTYLSPLSQFVDHLSEIVKQLKIDGDSKQKEIDHLSRKYIELKAIIEELLDKEVTEAKIMADLIEKVDRHDNILGIAQIVTITTKQLDFLEGRHANDGS